MVVIVSAGVQARQEQGSGHLALGQGSQDQGPRLTDHRILGVGEA
jgi:hypothetical protein